MTQQACGKMGRGRPKHTQVLALMSLGQALQVRRIVVGRGGAAVGEIGVSARKDLEAALNERVHLMLNVKVAKKSKA